MLLNTLFGYPHTATLYKFTTRDLGNKNFIREYYSAGDIKVKLLPGLASGGRPTLYTPVKLNSFDRIANVRDTGGTVIGENALYGYETAMVIPVMNPMGYIQGWSYSLSRLTTDPTAQAQYTVK